MSHSLRTLSVLPPGVAETADVIARLDHCFLTGFGRMSEREVEAVSALPRLLSQTPLAARVKEACDALLRSEFVETHFVSIACARAIRPEQTQHFSLFSKKTHTIHGLKITK